MKRADRQYNTAMTAPRTAVVLCNLGGPDSLEAVEPFLRNLFSDPDIFKFPAAAVTQNLFAWLVARRRREEASRGYAALGGASPIGGHTEDQAWALEQALADLKARVFVCMRYWHPLTREVVAALKAGGFGRIVLLPLYPQYSQTTSGSARNEFLRECARVCYHPDTRFIDSWYQEPDYLDGIAAAIRAAAERFSAADPARISLLLSAHGVPQRLIAQGDPYQRGIEETARLVRERLAWPHVTLCYQSRVGPLEWLRPYVDDVIREQARAGVDQILVYPIAFVSDHVETLYELGITYARLAREAGVREYHVVPALNTDPALIRALSHVVRAALREER
ncbi:ferrochelatase [Acidiferrobacter sp.]|uniref:ferrochelatase n=2 Tax=Acidiferrobacter sp. TaxID=1872107 RepID=UPI0026076E96|nr:ferrochelatase [Acidiferrobacter sp.]